MHFNGLRVVLLFLALVPGASLIHAQPPQPGDYAGFERFPGSELTDFRHQQNTVYDLALGRMQRVDGRVSPSRAERLQGALTRVTYEIPSGYSAGDAYQHFRDQLLSDGQSAVFECQGRGCGSSNFWANDKFGNRVLYGPESGQYYLASTYRSERNGVPVSGYAALYTITRGNRRVYAHLDFLELPPVDDMQLMVTPEAMLSRLQEDGSAVLQNLAYNDDDELVGDDGIDLLVQALRRDTLLEVYLVAHLRLPGEDTDILLARSQERAEQLLQRLVEEGINASRLEAYGVGPLVPYCLQGPCHNRVELVTRP